MSGRGSAAWGIWAAIAVMTAVTAAPPLFSAHSAAPEPSIGGAADSAAAAPEREADALTEAVLSALGEDVAGSEEQNPAAQNDPASRAAQEALAALGFDPGAVDGVWGPRSGAALLAFQAAAGLEATDGLTADAGAALEAAVAASEAGAPLIAEIEVLAQAAGAEAQRCTAPTPTPRRVLALRRFTFQCGGELRMTLVADAFGILRDGAASLDGGPEVALSGAGWRFSGGGPGAPSADGPALEAIKVTVTFRSAP